MLRAIIAGERNPEALAQKAASPDAAEDRPAAGGLDCSFFTPDHAFVLQMMLDNIDQLTAQIAVLDEQIAILCEPYERQVAQLDGIPGFGVRTAQDLIGEIGVDMTAFPTAGHLCSWARLAPRVRESAGRQKGKNATGRGNPYIGGTLGEAAAGAGRTQTFLGAKYRRLCTRMPKKKAQGAVVRGTSSSSPRTPSCPTPRPGTATSAPATTSSASAPGAARAATSAASSVSATRSPSSPSPLTPTPKPAS